MKPTTIIRRLPNKPEINSGLFCIGNDMSKIKNLTAAGALILSIALAGCNNNSDPVPDPMEPQAAEKIEMAAPIEG